MTGALMLAALPPATRSQPLALELAPEPELEPDPEPEPEPDSYAEAMSGSVKCSV